MKGRRTWLKSIAVITVLGFALAGCAAMNKSDTSDTEQLLAAAGFKMIYSEGGTTSTLDLVKSRS